MYSMVRIRYVHMGLWKLPRFGAFFVLIGTAFRCFILEPVPDVPLVRLWGSIGTRIPIWDPFQELRVSCVSRRPYKIEKLINKIYHLKCSVCCICINYLQSFGLQNFEGKFMESCKYWMKRKRSGTFQTYSGGKRFHVRQSSISSIICLRWFRLVRCY
jgi:hypothetical protein